MVIYNVTIKIEQSIADEWVRWMKEEHIPDLMQTGLFTGSRLCRLLEQDDSEGPTYSAQYMCDGIDQYNRYIAEYAENMRNKANALYGGRFAAFRTVMQEI